MCSQNASVSRKENRQNISWCLGSWICWNYKNGGCRWAREL